VGNDERNENEEPAQPAASGKQDNLVHAPTLNLPKGGGAIRGMERSSRQIPSQHWLHVNSHCHQSWPIRLWPATFAFLRLRCRQGPFGLGWNLPLPSITRKTDKGLPYYNDADESDVFILSRRRRSGSGAG